MLDTRWSGVNMLTKTNKLFCLFSAFVVLVVLGTLLRWDQLLDASSAASVHYELSVDGFLVNTPGCVIPDMDPFDPSVLKLYAAQTVLYCKSLPPLVTVNYQRGEIRLDQKVASRFYKENPASLNCSYRAIRRERNATSDKEILVDKSGLRLPAETAVVVQEEFIYVQCLNHWGKEIYSDYVPFVHRKAEVEERVAKILSAQDGGAGRKESTEAAKLMSVVLLGIDSVSRLNFIRHFPKTRRFLMEEMKALQLLGYTKVGDNTYPNIVPMLSGMDVRELPKGFEGNRPKPFDDLPLIWKNFSRSGYRTLYAEEIPTISAFNYLKSGFHRQPTDYYYRPFTLATEPSSMRRRSSEHCFNRRMEIDVVLTWLRHFLSEFRDEPTFSLTFVSRLTHDRLNSAGFADRPYHDFLRGSHSRGLFNNSVLFFFSDHGIRFGAIRDTYVGKLEERLPFAFLVFPEWFRERFPRLWSSLRRNQRRLTTPFDVHATLEDLMRFDGSDEEAFAGENDARDRRDLTLLRTVPEERTCADANILPHWCVCHEKKPGDAGSAVALKAADALVDVINRKLAPSGGRCAPLTLARLQDVRVGALGQKAMTFNAKSKAPVSGVYDYLLTVKLAPSDGVFEGTVRYREGSGQFFVMEPISRISKYGGQSNCVNSTELRRFCYCRSSLR